MSAGKLKIFFVFVGDVIVLYLALLLALVLRYGSTFYSQFTSIHFVPFTIVFIPWLIVFFIAGLYDLRRLHNNLDFIKTLTLAVVANAIIAALLFYLVPSFGIAPKTNLLLFIIVFAVIELLWRRWFNRTLASEEPQNKIAMIGSGPSAAEIAKALTSNPQLGYLTVSWIKDDSADLAGILKTLARDGKINGIVVPRHLKRNYATASALYELLSAGIEIHDLANFYELVMGKVPLADLEEAWFLENLLVRNPLYEFLKRVVDIISAIILGIIAIPLFPVVAIGIALSSPGPIFFKQERIGKHGKAYVHYKFRTMRENNEKTWNHDGRITGIGRLLRRTHLDELPQVFNLFRGEVSLVGPRPDFIDFFNKLKIEIPFYTIRTIATPGLTGWAQVNFPTTASIEETKERFCYDLYYLKNRSFALDILIALKTIKTVITAAGK